MDETSRRTRLTKERYKKTALKLLIAAAVVLVIVGIAGLALSRARDLVIERLVEVAPVQEGALEQTETVTGLLLHPATLITSPVRGQVDFLVPEGERVRVGTVIARVKTNKGTADVDQVEMNLKTSRSGVVCYHPDGLEELATADILDKLPPSRIRELKSEPIDVRRQETVDAGEPVARIIDNLEPTLIYAEIPFGLFAEPLTEGGNIRFVIGKDGDSYEKAKIVALKGSGDKAEMVLALPTYRQDLIDRRQVEMKVLVRRFAGVVVPVAALVPKEGKNGVYTVHKGVVRWREVQVESRLKEQATVEGITPGTRIVLNPGLTEEGDMVE
jgi:putative membrane fusion protein